MRSETLRDRPKFHLHAFLDGRTKGKYCLHQEAGRMIIDSGAATE